MTPAGFPHSDICGSRFVRQLPAAFRSLPRLSSPPGAKASTVHPYALDHFSCEIALDIAIEPKVPGQRTARILLVNQEGIGTKCLANRDQLSLGAFEHAHACSVAD